MAYEEKEVRIEDVVSPWNGRHYIGFVMDIVQEHLGKVMNGYHQGDEYHLGGGHGDLHELEIVTMTNGDERKIVVRRDQQDMNRYFISGFPEGGDFNFFRCNAQRLWNEYRERIVAEPERGSGKL